MKFQVAANVILLIIPVCTSFHPLPPLHHRRGTPLYSIEPSPGQPIGDEFVLTGAIGTSSSGKSYICEATSRVDGEDVIVKLSKDLDAMRRENENYEKIIENTIDENLFIKNKEYVESNTYGAIVMEKGDRDLKEFIEENGPLSGEELHATASNIAECIQAVHDAEMVWTEIKAENFVVADQVKAIDLESAVPVGDNPIDYSPEACPPEFAVAYLCGREPNMELEQSFDVWSLGILLLEISTGKHYFDDSDCQVDIAMRLKNELKVDVPKTDDPQLQEVIEWCLTRDANLRPTMEQVLAHPYFQNNSRGQQQ